LSQPFNQPLNQSLNLMIIQLVAQPLVALMPFLSATEQPDGTTHPERLQGFHGLLFLVRRAALTGHS
jgi:hypothetical protein